MRRLLLFAFLLLATPLWAATKYVDNGCTKNGDGTAINCAAADGGAGPYNSIANAASAAGCGSGGVPDTINVRGLHDIHGSCPGSNGVYNFNNATFAQSCSSTNELILQSYGWTAVGALTQEVVYIQNTNTLSRTPGVDWTRCTDCSASSSQTGCRNVPHNDVTTFCGDAWFHTPSAGKKALWAVHGNAITPRQSSLANLALQYDAYSTDAADTILTVRWASGATLPSTVDVNGENNQFITQITGDYIIFRGLNFRFNINSAINITSTSDHATIQDNTFKYFNDSGNGSARALYTDGVTGPAEILDNEFAYTSSEPWHITTVTTGANATHLARNWVHGIGDLTTLGIGTSGTPNCTTFTSDAPCCGYSTIGNFTGTIVENNLFDGCGNSSYSGGRKAILMESHCDNLIVRNNVIRGAGTCFKWHPYNGGTGNHTLNNQIYNNLCLNPSFGDSEGFQMRIEGAGPITGNKVFNNTVIGAAGGALAGDNDATVTGNLFRNNIFYYNGTIKQVQFDATDATNHFDNNLVYITGNGNAATWAGVSYDCAHMSTLGSGNINACPDPVFVNAGGLDYHIQSASPAKDAGTATGMPAGRTADINNTIVSAHGFPSYADANPIQNSVWDIGADELISGGGSGTTILDITATDSPDPVNVGSNITYTLTYHNTGSAQASNVAVADVLPTGVTFVSASSGGALYPSGNVIWTIGTVAASGSGAVTFTVTVNSTIGHGAVIYNSSYGITSDETGLVLGAADSTTVSNSHSKRGRLFPGGMR